MVYGNGRLIQQPFWAFITLFDFLLFSHSLSHNLNLPCIIWFCINILFVMSLLVYILKILVHPAKTTKEQAKGLRFLRKIFTCHSLKVVMAYLLYPGHSHYTVFTNFHMNSLTFLCVCVVEWVVGGRARHLKSPVF